jgi:hypothetical protein
MIKKTSPPDASTVVGYGVGDGSWAYALEVVNKV